MTRRDAPRPVPGGLFVPASLARALFEFLVPALAAGLRATHGTATVPDDVRDFLQLLHAVDVADTGPMSAIGHATEPPATVVDMRSPDEAGREVGLSARQVRRLCASGAVDHKRVGARAYLVDVGSLHAYLRGGAQ